MNLIHEAIALLKEESLTPDSVLGSVSGSILATPEEAAYFSPQKKQLPPKEKKVAEFDAEMKQLVTKLLPEVALSSGIPDDAAAKKMAHLYKEQHLNGKVIILSFGETGAGLSFLQNVTKAIDSLLAPTKLVEMRKIERENSWELTLTSPTLQLILAPPFQAWKTLTLARFYRENPASKSHFLKETPVLMMQSVEAYLKNPDLKRDLWKMVSSLLSMST
ncbi:MAG TPA: hypothetical protein VFU89_00980 [Rhabdochlamydiaceae bacterium]|nr:hypothetical protein [Rhabdochlamydiaceae bacterium]